MSLLSCSNELILIIAENLGAKEHYFLMKTNHRFHDLLRPRLHKLTSEDPLLSKTAFIWSAARRDEGMVRWLLENTKLVEPGGRLRVVEPYIEDNDRVTWKTICIAPNDFDTAAVNYIISKGPDIHIEIDDRVTRTEGRAALHWAIKGGHALLVRHLLEHGAEEDFHLGYNDGPWGALPMAIEDGRESIVRVVLEHGKPPDMRTPSQKEDIVEAVSERFDLPITRLLLEKGFITTGGTLLHLAAASNSCSIEYFKLLFEYGADVNALDCSGYTPLRFAVEGACVETVKLFIEKGADVSQRDNLGKTLLHLAVRPSSWLQRKDPKGVALLLLKKGIDINARDSKGCTAISMTNVSQMELINLLLDYGAQYI